MGTTMGRTPEFVTDSPYWSKHVRYIEPHPLYIMCWCNFFRHDRADANALHWHEHMWPYQGYLSVDSEGGATNFRSNVHTGKRFRFDHTTGMLFLLPGGTLHASAPWTNPEHARITVAFNLALVPKPGWVWVELFSKEEMAPMFPPNDMRYNTWAIAMQRPHYPYSQCHTDEGVCPEGNDKNYINPLHEKRNAEASLMDYSTQH